MEHQSTGSANNGGANSDDDATTRTILNALSQAQGRDSLLQLNLLQQQLQPLVTRSSNNSGASNYASSTADSVMQQLLLSQATASLASASVSGPRAPQPDNPFAAAPSAAAAAAAALSLLERRQHHHRQQQQQQQQQAAILANSPDMVAANLHAQAMLLQQEESLRNTRMLLLQQLEQANSSNGGRRASVAASRASAASVAAVIGGGGGGGGPTVASLPASADVATSSSSQEASRPGKTDKNESAADGEDQDNNNLNNNNHNNQNDEGSCSSSDVEDDEQDDDEYFANFDTEDSHRVNMENFPNRLYRMLYQVEKSGRQDVVSFSSNGQIICFHKPKRFVNEIMPEFFSTTRIASLQRQLNLYGFQRINEGRYRGGYHHAYFRKGKRSLCRKIKRQKTRVGKESQAPQSVAPGGSIPSLPGSSAAAQVQAAHRDIGTLYSLSVQPSSLGQESANEDQQARAASATVTAELMRLTAGNLDRNRNQIALQSLLDNSLVGSLNNMDAARAQLALRGLLDTSNLRRPDVGPMPNAPSQNLMLSSFPSSVARRPIGQSRAPPSPMSNFLQQALLAQLQREEQQQQAQQTQGDNKTVQKDGRSDPT